MARAPARRGARTQGRRAFDLTAYERSIAAFFAEQGEAEYANLAGLRPDLDLAPVYQRHEELFTDAAIDQLRRAAHADNATTRRARRLLAFAVAGNLERSVADLSDRLAASESTAVVVWRGERIGYRQAAIRVAEQTDRAERNALDERYRLAMEAMNPIREERWGRLHARARELGAKDYVALVADTADFDPEALAASLSGMLTETETPYYAALRRYLALIEIEGGDGSAADLAHLLRGRAFDQYFDAGRLVAVLGETLAGLGITLGTQPGITLDLEPRPTKSPRAFCVPIRVPGDIRLVVQPRGGHEDYGGALHELGHLEHYAHLDPRLPPADRYLGDDSVTEGWAFLFQHLLADEDWLARELRMPRDVIGPWLDFGAFRKAYYIRRYAAKLLYELRLHRDEAWAVHRVEYSGLLGLMTGVRMPDAGFLADVDDGFYAAKYLRAWVLEGSLSTALRDRYGSAWWRNPDAGEQIRAMWRGGLGPTAEDVVASLGYDHLDWRPVLRQIRAQLIGEMSGYGGPNITTRAGSRKV